MTGRRAQHRRRARGDGRSGLHGGLHAHRDGPGAGDHLRRAACDHAGAAGVPDQERVVDELRDGGVPRRRTARADAADAQARPVLGRAVPARPGRPVDAQRLGSRGGRGGRAGPGRPRRFRRRGLRERDGLPRRFHDEPALPGAGRRAGAGDPQHPLGRDERDGRYQRGDGTGHDARVDADRGGGEGLARSTTPRPSTTARRSRITGDVIRASTVSRFA